MWCHFSAKVEYRVMTHINSYCLRDNVVEDLDVGTWISGMSSSDNVLCNQTAIYMGNSIFHERTKQMVDSQFVRGDVLEVDLYSFFFAVGRCFHSSDFS